MEMFLNHVPNKFKKVILDYSTNHIHGYLERAGTILA
jgi:hypothetical protein